jgi:hypothetical protein
MFFVVKEFFVFAPVFEHLTPASSILQEFIAHVRHRGWQSLAVAV